jgi:hypothetical protein
VQSFGDVSEATAQLPLVRSGDGAGWMIRSGKLGGDVELRASAIIWPADAFSDPFQLRLEFRLRVSMMALRDAVPALPEILVLPVKERRNQVVLGPKMSIKACLGDTGFFHDKVHAHGTHTSAIEERGRRFEDAISHINGAVGGTVADVGRYTMSHSRVSRLKL